MASILSLIDSLILNDDIQLPIYLSKSDLVDRITLYSSESRDEISDLVYDEIDHFNIPQYIAGCYVVWERFMAKIHICPLSNFETLKDTAKYHELVIDAQIYQQIEKLTPHSFESFIGHLLKSNRDPIFERVRVSPKSGDGGVDFRAFQIEESNRKRIVGEAKKWSGPVNPGVVDRLVRVMDIEEEKYEEKVRGVLVSLNGITDGARERVFGRDVEFWDTQTLIRMARESLVGVSHITVPVIDNEWLNYDMIVGD